MTPRPILFVATLITAMAINAMAREGVTEISQSMMPYVITNPGNYILTQSVSQENSLPVTLVARAATWRYLATGVDPGTNWAAIAFDASAWNTGAAELGFGDGGEATVLAGGRTTYYFRATFVLTNAASYNDLDLFVRRDDGVVIYLNGTEVTRNNMPTGTVTGSTLALATIAGADESTYTEFDILHTLMVNGTNVLAAEVHQANGGFVDLSFDAELRGDVGNAVPITSGITIQSDNVVLDLNGHTMTGVYTGTVNGIYVPTGRDIVIRNGSVVNWNDDGIHCLLATNVIIQNIRALRNGDDGIHAGERSLVIDCVASENGVLQTVPLNDHGNGILVSDASLVADTFTLNNHNHGVDAATAVMVTGLITARNDHDALHGGQANQVSRSLAYRNSGEGLEVNVGSVMVDCAASLNDDGFKARAEPPPVVEGRVLFSRLCATLNNNDGIKGEFGSLFAFCNAHDNADDGITVESYTMVANCMSSLNGFRAGSTPGGGIAFEAGRNIALGNHLVRNEYGITSVELAGAVNNIAFRNSAFGNTISNYAVRAGNFFAPATNSPTAASPWANFAR